MEEIWMPIKRYEHYEVSNKGNIKSLKRIITDRLNREFKIEETIRKQYLHKNGYMTVVLCTAEKDKTFSVHRLIAEAFLPNPENKQTVNHKNGIKTDNNVSNLEWMTYKENQQHAYDKLGKKGPSFRKCYQYDKKDNLLNIFESLSQAARKTNINVGSIQKCCATTKIKTYNNKAQGIHSAGGFVWSYELKNKTE